MRTLGVSASVTRMSNIYASKCCLRLCRRRKVGTRTRRSFAGRSPYCDLGQELSPSGKAKAVELRVYQVRESSGERSWCVERSDTAMALLNARLEAARCPQKPS